jgi:hypothetical protein
MKKLALLLIILTISISCSFSQETKKSYGTYIGTFDGRTPCHELAGQLNEPIREECTKIKWRFKFYKDPANSNTGTFELTGFVFKRDNPTIGKWHTIKGTTANPDAIVYYLDVPGKSPLLLQKADENIFFFLDANKNLLVGNRDFSYTLNRKPE